MKERIVFTFKILALLAGVTFIAEAQSAEYDVVKRFKLLEDKFSTHDMLTPFGHDFILDINLLVNKNLPTIISDAKDVSKVEGDAAKLAAGQAFLRKYDKTEQNLRLKLTIGAPLPTFHAWGVKIVPDFRASASLQALLGIRTETYTFAQILNFVGSDVPDVIRNAILSCSEPAAGADIVKHLVDASCITDPSQVALAQTYYNKYFRPTDSSVPLISTYAKGEGRLGFNFNYFHGEHYFGNLNIYGLGRADIKSVVSAETLTKNGDIVDLGEELNTTVNLVADYKFGYKNGNLSGFASVEELKISRMSDNEDKGVKLNYGDDPLIRVHGEYLYKFVGFDLKPFAGTHIRSGYGAGDGLYGGADIGYYVWQDRIGLRFRGMLDKEHFTFSPAAKLWLMHLEYMLKTPMKSEVDGVKPATVHAVNFRLFF
ncbi:MAG: hypothetical protein Fur0010_25870 [Bdellovibrio sp.]